MSGSRMKNSDYSVPNVVKSSNSNMRDTENWSDNLKEEENTLYEINDSEWRLE